MRTLFRLIAFACFVIAAFLTDGGTRVAFVIAAVSMLILIALERRGDRAKA